MSFLETAKKRYAVKQYNTTEKISDIKIQELKEIIHLSPSSINSQPWKFFFITDDTTKRALAKASYWNEQKVNDSSHLVVFCAYSDISLFENQIKETLPPSFVDYYNDFVKSKGPEYVKSWMQHQVYLSLGFFLAACATIEIDSTPMEGIDNASYNSILQLEGYETLFSVAIGYRHADDVNQPTKSPKSRLPFTQAVSSL